MLLNALLKTILSSSKTLHRHEDVSKGSLIVSTLTSFRPVVYCCLCILMYFYKIALPVVISLLSLSHFGMFTSNFEAHAL